MRRLLRDDAVRDALARAAAESGAQLDHLLDAFALASEYDAPQRALSCALYVVRVRAMRERLDKEGRKHELYVLDSVSQESSYAVFLAAPFAAQCMSDAVTTVALRRAFGLTVLAAESVKCRTKSGYEKKQCTSGAAVSVAGDTRPEEMAGDAHALTCKCGGGAIHTHDRVVRAIGKLTTEWGIATKLEEGEYLGPNQRMDLVIPLAGRPGTLGLAIDVTRRVFGSPDILRAAESAKEIKYTNAFLVPMDMNGFAFNDYAVIGKRARAVLGRLVELGARTTGGHAEDLRLEMLATLGAAVYRGNAAALAYFGEVNGDRRPGVPPMSALEPEGTKHATSITGGPLGARSGGAKRGRKRKQGNGARVTGTRVNGNAGPAAAAAAAAAAPLAAAAAAAASVAPPARAVHAAAAPTRGAPQPLVYSTAAASREGGA